MITNQEARDIAGSGSVFSPQLMSFHKTGYIFDNITIMQEAQNACRVFLRRSEGLPHWQGRKTAQEKLSQWTALVEYLDSFNHSITKQKQDIET